MRSEFAVIIKIWEREWPLPHCSYSTDLIDKKNIGIELLNFDDLPRYVFMEGDVLREYNYDFEPENYIEHEILKGINKELFVEIKGDELLLDGFVNESSAFLKRLVNINQMPLPIELVHNLAEIE